MENCFTRVKSISDNSMFWCVRDIALILMIGLGIVHRIQCFRTRLSCTLAEENNTRPFLWSGDLTAAIRYNSFNGRNQHTAFLWSGGPLIQRGQYHRVTYMCAQRMVKRDMIYHSPVMQCMSKYMCCMTCLPCSNNDPFHGITQATPKRT